MDTNETEPQVEVEVEEEVEAEEETDAPPTATTDWEARAKVLEEKAIIQRERTRTLKDRLAKLEKAQAPKAETPKTGELDETTLDYFDLKGYSDLDEIDIFRKIMLKTGMSAREAIKDDYALAKVKALREDKEVKDATPSSTRRSGNSQTNDIGIALARYEATGKLPDDFALRSAIINAKTEKENPNKPAWK